MIYKRAVAKLRAQDWFAILVEFAIVVAGVFVGTWVANLNQQRLATTQMRGILAQVRPDLIALRDFYPSNQNYYKVARDYADVALAGWRRDPRVSDRDFVIAAYQATQVNIYSFNAGTWGSVVGAEQVRSLPASDLRRDLSAIITLDYSPLQMAAVSTSYRQQVRKLIPLALEEQIRGSCGDVLPRDQDPKGNNFVLPARCGIAVDLALAASVAAKLRAHPELVDELSWHFAQVAIAVGNAKYDSDLASEVVREIDHYLGEKTAR